MSVITPLRTGLLIVTLTASSAALADPTCTSEPESSWMPFEQAKQQVLDMGYSIKKFKTTKTSCYELYGYDAEKHRVEIYFNPVDMSKVKEEKDD